MKQKPIDQAAVKLETRLLAIEYFVAEAFKMLYMLAGASQKGIEKSHEHFRERLRTMRIPASDPAIADLAAGELEVACIRLLTKIQNAGKD
jgi:hypothetical protein